MGNPIVIAALVLWVVIILLSLFPIGPKMGYTEIMHQYDALYEKSPFKGLQY